MARRQCTECDYHAPSQAAEPLIMTPPPEYLPISAGSGGSFRGVWTSLSGVCRSVNWLDQTGSSPLVHVQRADADTSATFLPIWSPRADLNRRGTSFVSTEMTEFFRRWSVKVRQSSAQYPQSNDRAEEAVKTAKAIMRNNTGHHDSLAMEKVASALLQYHNTPLRQGGRSPAQLLMGRQLRGGVPVSVSLLHVHEQWKEDLARREKMMAQKADYLEMSSRNCCHLTKLAVGQRVRVQNAVTKLWDRTGVVTRILRAIRQYTVRLDGSGRLVLRNRKFLKPIDSPTVEERRAPSSSRDSESPPQFPRRSERLALGRGMVK